jgi:hypothetical protein
MSYPALGTRDSVPWYAVLSIEKDRALEASGHSHVLGLATRDPDGGETHWTLVQVISAIRDGERFVVGEDPGDQSAAVEPTVCPRCPMATLVVGPSPR